MLSEKPEDSVRCENSIQCCTGSRRYLIARGKTKIYFLINFFGVISRDKRRSVSRQYGEKCGEKKQKIELRKEEVKEYVGLNIGGKKRKEISRKKKQEASIEKLKAGKCKRRRINDAEIIKENIGEKKRSGK